MPLNRPIGFAAVESVFHQAMLRKRVHHAWMFHGVAGIGKSWLAKSLAQDALCRTPDTDGFACNRCSSCAMMQEDSHPDFLLVTRQWDEKKKRFKRDISIDQIREMLDFLSLSSFDDGYRLVVLSDLDHLNHQAANALLKGLEEPASGGVLLLVCHQAQHAMATIRSRCLMQACSTLQQDDCRRVLQNFDLPADICDLAARWARGRPGTVQCLSDEAAAQSALALHHHTQQLAHGDIAELCELLQRTVTVLPHSLISTIVVSALTEDFIGMKFGWKRGNRMLDAMDALLRWPGDVHRHTLRPHPSLFDRMLELRTACRS